MYIKKTKPTKWSCLNESIDEWTGDFVFVIFFVNEFVWCRLWIELTNCAAYSLFADCAGNDDIDISHSHTCHILVLLAIGLIKHTHIHTFVQHILTYIHSRILIHK